MNSRNNDLLISAYHKLKKEGSFSVRNLVPKSPIGHELRKRFQEEAYRTNPSESPMVQALIAHGYHVVDYPMYPEYTDSDWLASSVSMRGLKIVFRQPTPHDVAICFMKREKTEQKIVSPLFGITEFFSFCRYDCPGLSYVGGNLDKLFDWKNNESKLSMDRLLVFYNKLLGDIESYEEYGIFFIYAELHRDSRFEKFPIWKRVRKTMIENRQRLTQLSS